MLLERMKEWPLSLVRQYFLIVLNGLADLQILDEALTSSIDRPVRAHGVVAGF